MHVKKCLTMECLLLLVLAIAPAAEAAATPSPACITGKYARYAQAQRSWQRELAKLIVEVAPDHAPIARQYMDDQLRRIEAAELAVAYLAHADPSELRTRMSLNNWLDLDERDRQRIAGHRQRYAQLMREEDAARRRPPHSQADSLQALMRTDVSRHPKYRPLIDELMRSVEAIERSACALGRPSLPAASSRG